MSRKTKTLQLLYERDRGDSSINPHGASTAGLSPFAAAVHRRWRDDPERQAVYRPRAWAALEAGYH